MNYTTDEALEEKVMPRNENIALVPGAEANPDSLNRILSAADEQMDHILHDKDAEAPSLQAQRMEEASTHYIEE